MFRELKNFIVNPKLNITHACFGPAFTAEALSQTRLLVDDIEQTYNRTLNRCITSRTDLLSRLSVGLGMLSFALAILSIILGILGVVR